MSPRPLFVVTFVVAFGLDQLTKALARAWLVEGKIEPFLGTFWDWRLAYNKGVAFSMGWGTTPWILASFALIAAIVAGVFAWRSGHRGIAFAGGLIASGALGNAFDRVAFGKVTDFIHWYIGEHDWPAFNIADAALLVGAAVLIISDFRRQRAAKPSPSRSAP